MYHWEADQEDFLVVAGEAVLIIEGEERPLRQWDFVHCPPNAAHTIVGAGVGPCVVVAVGAREHDGKPDWGSYPVDETAARHGASPAPRRRSPARRTNTWRGGSRPATATAGCRARPDEGGTCTSP